MNRATDYFVCLTIIATRLAGIVLSHGYEKLAAIFPFYACYKVIERLMQAAGWI